MANVNDLLDIARADLGYKESPANSNRTKYGEWYGLNGQPWCMMAVQYWLNKAGLTPPIKTASCGAFLTAARKAGEAVYGEFRPGDVVIYDFDRNGTTDHCGIVESVNGATITAIEGNTAVGNDSDGGEVMRRTRKLSQIVGAYRPTFDKEVKEVRYNTVKECPVWAQETVRKLIRNGCLSGNGKKDAQGMPTDLDLSHDMIRLLVIHDKAKLFDK